MSDLLFVVIELGLLITLFCACLLSIHRRLTILLLLPFAAACALGALFGYPKSAYHLLLIGLMLTAASDIRWSQASRRLMKAGAVMTLLVIVVQMMINADWSLQSKAAAPQFYAAWGLLILLGAGHRWRGFAKFLIVVDLLISLLVAARGVLLGSLIALASFRRGRMNLRNLVSVLAVGSFALYMLAYPLLLLLNMEDVLVSSLSNTQRTLMNFKALLDTVSTPVTMSETAIFESAGGFLYGHDKEGLTVHNLILAVGLFNGLLPALLLGVLILRALRRLADTPYLPLAVYLYFVMLLGPDSFPTRYSLILLAGLLIIHGGPALSKTPVRRVDGPMNFTARSAQT